MEKVRIESSGAKGKSVGHVDGRVVFVPFGAVGDLVDIQVFKKKSSYYEGRIVAFHEYSSQRTEPPCQHFGLCGGCKWQHLAYEHQLAFKQNQVKNSLDRIAKVPYDELLPIIGCKDAYYYRNKLEFTFSNKRWLTDVDPSKEDGGPLNTNGLGFHLPGMFDKILDIDTCYLQADPSNQIRLAVKAYALQKGLEFYNVREWSGFLRNLIIRTTSTGDIMVIVIFRYDDLEIKDLLHHIAEQFPEISSLMYVVNEKSNDTITDQEIRLFKGNPFIMEEMPSPIEGGEPLRFKVGPVSFYQTNPDQAYKLYKAAFDFAECKGDELVYDLYTGTGTIAAFIARSVKKVIGIEYVEEAVVDARSNASLNSIDNTAFFSGDMAAVLTAAFIKEHGRPDVLFTDPPRSGMHEHVVRQILKMAPEKIVYISCNPETQARDIALLYEKYDVKKVQPVDMFPQTDHVENVVLLVLRA